MKSRAEIERMTQKFLSKHSKKKPSKKLRNRPFHNGEPRRDFNVVAGSFENGKNR